LKRLDNNARQFGNAAGGGFGSRRGTGKKGRIPRPYASEWENSVVSPRNEQIQNFKNQDKFGNENLNNNGRSVSSLSSPSTLMKDSNDDILEDSNTQNVCQSADNKNINLEENGNVEINGKDNKINGVKKDGEKFKNKEKTNQNKEEKEEGELTDEEDFKNLSNTSTLSVCSTTSLATVRRLSQSSDKNENFYNEAETRPASATASHFNKYRTKPPSLASEDDEGRNTMLIRKIKLGFSIERILEDLQNFGDIIEYKQLDETTAIFKFLDASEAELAAKVVSKNSNLFGNMAIFELQR
uniref:RRM domain-containing protein n=1 Tax=Meloidogyne floridensis TaxID=298350 RepID=A0A915NGV7_9BILA